MGRHTETMRMLIASIPDHSIGLTPEIARSCIMQIANGSLQIIAELEERLEDKDKEIDSLTERLLREDGTTAWTPKARGDYEI